MIVTHTVYNYTRTSKYICGAIQQLSTREESLASWSALDSNFPSTMLALFDLYKENKDALCWILGALSNLTVNKKFLQIISYGPRFFKVLDYSISHHNQNESICAYIARLLQSISGCEVWNFPTPTYGHDYIYLGVSTTIDICRILLLGL